MKFAIIIALCVISQCCTKKADVSQSNPDDRPESKVARHGMVPNQQPVRQQAKSALQDPRKCTPPAISEWAKKISSEEDINYLEALSILYSTLAGSQPHGDLRFKAAFYHVISDDSENISQLMGELPTGDLRRMCVGFIRGEDMPSDKLTKIYEAMPESIDRAQVANILVSTCYFKNGIDSALNSVRSLGTLDERTEALNNLASQMAGSYKLRGRNLSVYEIQQIREFAKEVGQEERISFYLKDISPGER